MKTQKKESVISDLWQSAYDLKFACLEMQRTGAAKNPKWFHTIQTALFIRLLYFRICRYFKALYDWYSTYETTGKATRIGFIVWYLNHQDDKLLKMWRMGWFHRYFWWPRVLRPYQNITAEIYDWQLCQLSKLPGRKVYGARFSRDCDMYERSWAQQYKNRWAYKYAELHLYDDCEGAESITPISKQEYEKFEESHRDRIMEAYENGNGTSIYV